jgi:hypothetical protein
MNMEQLTKSQIVLLTLLVSFVTSIATGIVTVALMGQAPPAITQTVSRVIRETVQSVTPATASQHASAAVTQEKTVVVAETDLIAKAVERVSASTVRLYVGSADAPTFVGLGIVLDSSGTIATDFQALDGSNIATIVLPNGSSIQASVRSRDSKMGIAYLLPATTTSFHFVPVTVASDHTVLGQSVVTLSGKSQTRIASGLIVALSSLTDASTSPQILETSLAPDAILPGSPLINTQGVLVGLSTQPSRAVSGSNFLSSSALMRFPLK